MDTRTPRRERLSFHVLWFAFAVALFAVAFGFQIALDDPPAWVLGAVVGTVVAVVTNGRDLVVFLRDRRARGAGGAEPEQ